MGIIDPWPATAPVGCSDYTRRVWCRMFEDPNVSLELTAAVVSHRLVGLADDFLRKLLGPAAEEAGLLFGDKVGEIRFRNRVRALVRARALLEDAGIEPGEPPLRTLVPLLEGCEWEEDATLREMWAALIANAAWSGESVPPVLAHIMAQLAPLDAHVLNRMFVIEGWARGAGSTSARPGAASLGASTRWEVEVAIENLENQGLVAQEPPEKWLEAVAERVAGKVLDEAQVQHRVFPRIPTTRQRGQYEVSLTALGEAFLLASLPPRKRPVSVDDVTNENYGLILRALHGAWLAAQCRGDKELENELRAERRRIREAFGGTEE